LVITVEVLSLRSGSNWSAATVAVLVMALAALDKTFTWMVKEVLAPLAKEPKLQLRMGSVPVQGTELERKLVPAGSVSLTTTLVASADPALAMLNV
jgi:hypothetical protein